MVEALHDTSLLLGEIDLSRALTKQSEMQISYPWAVISWILNATAIVCRIYNGAILKDLEDWLDSFKK